MGCPDQFSRGVLQGSDTTDGRGGEVIGGRRQGDDDTTERGVKGVDGNPLKGNVQEFLYFCEV